MSNPQSRNRYSYVLNNPVKYIDPSGHRYCDLDGLDCEDHGDDGLYGSDDDWDPRTWSNGGGGNGGQTGNIKKDVLDIAGLGDLGYSDWEISILEILYNDGGVEGAQSVQYIVENNIHIKVGEPFEYHETIGIDYFTGDWQSLGNIGAWYEGDDLIALNPNAGYSEQTVPDIWGISLVAHEALHISQGWRSWTKGGEMEAWQLGIKIFQNLGGILSTRDIKVLNATSIHDFASAIKHYDNTGYWKGLRILPPWISVPKE